MDLPASVRFSPIPMKSHNAAGDRVRQRLTRGQPPAMGMNHQDFILPRVTFSRRSRLPCKWLRAGFGFILGKSLFTSSMSAVPDRYSRSVLSP